VDEDFFEEGFMFDGSSIAGWKSIDQSDMKLMPDATSVYIDPFYAEKTLCVHCNVVEPDTGEAYQPLPAPDRAEGRGLSEVLRHRRHRLFRARKPNSSSSTTCAIR
jgi:glutamine synthetase